MDRREEIEMIKGNIDYMFTIIAGVLAGTLVLFGGELRSYYGWSIKFALIFFVGTIIILVLLTIAYSKIKLKGLKAKDETTTNEKRPILSKPTNSDR